MNSHNRLILKLILALLTAVVSLSNACGSALAVDCNRNGGDDQVDISGAASADCNENGIPDECEFAPLQFGLREQALSVERFPRALTSGDFD